MGGGDTNVYRYAANDPISTSDPSGEIVPWLASCAVGAAFGAAVYLGVNAISGRKSGAQGLLGSAASGCVTNLLIFGVGALFARPAATAFASSSGASNFIARAAELTRVGRWMSKAEYAAMKETGFVQASTSGVTHVSVPPNAQIYAAQAAKGSVFVEFDVPAARVVALGDSGIGRIIGPAASDIYNLLRVRRGLEPFLSPSPAFNISDILRVKL
jgi:hypothetical protein